MRGALSPLSLHGTLHHLIAADGYWVVALIVGVEGVGIPLPGETTLIVAALYVASSHDLRIDGVIAAAALGAIIGDNAGFWIGRSFGYRLLFRFRAQLEIPDGKIKLGQYLFGRYGRFVAFAARFVAVLRSLAPLLAGANRMHWPHFALADAAGALVWACVYGGGAYVFGAAIHHLARPAAWALLSAAILLGVIGFRTLCRHADALEAQAERALPGSLSPPG